MKDAVLEQGSELGESPLSWSDVTQKCRSSDRVDNWGRVWPLSNLHGLGSRKEAVADVCRFFRG